MNENFPHATCTGCRSVIFGANSVVKLVSMSWVLFSGEMFSCRDQGKSIGYIFVKLFGLVKMHS